MKMEKQEKKGGNRTKKIIYRKHGAGEQDVGVKEEGSDEEQKQDGVDERGLLKRSSRMRLVCVGG